MEKLWSDKLRRIEPYVPGEQSKNKNIIKLNANENPYPPSPKAIEALRTYPYENLRRYPNSSAQLLREALAKHYKISPDEIFVGNGSDEVIALAFMSFFNSDKAICFPDITYSFYPVWCSLYEIPYRQIPLDANFRIKAEDYYEPNGGVILPNPNAPTGISEGRAFIEKILEHNQDVIVIIDEAYVDFGGYSSIELLKKYENLLVVHTFSKSRSLAGMRIGAAMGNKALIRVLDAVKNSYNSYTMDALAIAAGAASVADNDYFVETVEKIKSTREKTVKQMEKLGFRVCPSHSNFIFVTHPSCKAEDIFNYLKKQDIFVRYFRLPRIENYLRITIGTDDDMAKMLEKIKEFMENK